MKGKTSGIVYIMAIAVIGLVVLVGGNYMGVFSTGQQADPTAPSSQCEYSPTVKINTPDLYGGAAVTTKNVYRIGNAAWTEVAGAGTFTANPGDVVEYVIGIGDANTEDDAQPFGPKGTYTVPCAPYPSITESVVDDDLATSITARAWDPEDGTVISISAPIDIDNGDTFSIKTEWMSTYQEDYGNRFCGEGNVIVVEYNANNYTSWTLTPAAAGNPYPSATVPSVHSTRSGYTTKAFEVPTLKSNEILYVYAIADASGSGKEPEGLYNTTLTMYDSNWYIDTSVTPSVIRCGIVDQDGNQVGAAGNVTLTIYDTIAS